MLRRVTHRAAVLAAAFCLAAAFALYGSTLRNSWCCDDTQILLHALRFSPQQYFSEPAAWRALVPYSLTPWLSLSYDLDHALAGMRTAAYYAHHLMMIGLAATLIWRLAALWVGPLFAASGALLFLVGVPIAQASQLLMVRHYTEGLVFYLLSLLLAALRLRGGSAWLLAASGLAYAVAASAKEIYLPLGLLPLLLPIGSWGQRLRTALPFGLVMLLYLPWRGYMLGDLVGGYTPADALASVGLAQVGEQLASLPGLMWQWPQLGGAAMVVTLLAALWRNCPRWPALWRLAVLLALLLLPLLPLVRFPGLVAGNERYLIALWAALSGVFAVALGHAFASHDSAAGAPARPGWHLAVAALLFAAVAAPVWPPARSALQVGTAVHQAHGAFVDALRQEPPDSVVLVHPSVPDWFVQGLIALRPAMGLGNPPPRVMADDIELVSLPAGVHRVLTFDPATARMTDISNELPARLAAWRAQLREVPMAVTIDRNVEQQSLRWVFSAPQPGRFSLLAAGQRLDAPAASDALRMERPLPPCFRIRFDAADGSISYSPPLALQAPDAQGRQHLHWQGNADLLPPGVPATCQPATAAAAP